jgi:polysaccharide export outer membrane protein
MIISWVQRRLSARRLTAAVLLAVTLAGCEKIPGDGPWMGGAQSTSTEKLPFDVIALTPETVAPYRPVGRTGLTSAGVTVAAAPRVSVAPGDALRIRMFEPYAGGILPTTDNPAAEIGLQWVGEDGTINVPFAGPVRVAGLDLLQIQNRIVSLLGNKARDPQVVVELATDRSNVVTVSGDVNRPGNVSLLDGVRSVVDAVGRRGGLLEPADPVHTEVVVRRRGDIVLIAQYAELLAGHDLPVEKGDEIVVRPNTREYTALGAVSRTGNHKIIRPGMTLMDALGQIGGMQDRRANRTGVFVFRLAAGQPSATPAASKVFVLNFAEPQSIFIAQQFGIQAKDVLYVSNAPMYEYQRILSVLYNTGAIFRTTSNSLL